MVSTLGKAMRVLRGPSPARRMLLAANKSPLRHALKSGLSLVRLPAKLHRRRLARRRPLPPELRPHVQALMTDGYAVLSDVVEPRLLDELEAAGLAKARQADSVEQADRNKSFWTRLLDEDVQAARLDLDNVFVRFALQPRVLDVVSAFFGEVPYLSYVFLSLSRTDGDDLTYSQLWHRDYDDVKVAKLFTYLSDVHDPGDGPFTFFPKPASRRIRNSFVTRHLPDEAVFRDVSAGERRVMFGPRRTSFMVQTSHCYHMGSRMAPGRSRLMYTATYVTVPSLYGAADNRIVADPGRLSAIERLLLSPS